MIRASFSRATRPATVGVAANVPPMRVELPWKKILNMSDWAEMSGIACTFSVSKDVPAPQRIDSRDHYCVAISAHVECNHNVTHGLKRLAKVPLGRFLRYWETASSWYAGRENYVVTTKTEILLGIWTAGGLPHY